MMRVECVRCGYGCGCGCVRATRGREREERQMRSAVRWDREGHDHSQPASQPDARRQTPDGPRCELASEVRHLSPCSPCALHLPT